MDTNTTRITGIPSTDDAKKPNRIDTQIPVGIFGFIYNTAFGLWLCGGPGLYRPKVVGNVWMTITKLQRLTKPVDRPGIRRSGNTN